MKTKIILYLMLLFCVAVVFACGKEPALQTIYLTGTVGGEAVTNHPDKPTMVIVLKGDSIENLSASDLSAGMDDIIEYISIDRNNLSFHIDLTDKELNAGDEIALIAFVDINNNGSFPFPNEGDFMGFYIDEEAMSPTYQLNTGGNEGVHIDITREIFDFQATVTGSVTGQDMGNVMIVAYAGEIDSLDLEDTFDFDGIIGFQQIEKSSSSQAFTMDILPIGMNVPIQDVFLFAFLDKNNNDKPDGGDLIGFLADEDKMPAMMTIEEGSLTDKNIELTMELPEPSGYDVPLAGTIEMPDGEVFHENSPPLYVIIVTADSLTSFSDDLFGSVKYFKKLTSSSPPEQGKHFVDFTVDLSSTDLVAGNDVMVTAFWDRDYESGFLKPTEGDSFGFYNNKDNLSFSITLENQGQTNIPTLGADEFKLNKLWYEHTATIKYRFEEGALAGNYEIGDQIMVVAVQEDGVVFDLFDPSLDMDYVVGMQTIEVDNTTFDKNPNQYFEMELLPFQLDGLVSGSGFNIDNVGIFAIHGMDEGELPGNGDYLLGYYWEWLIAFIPKYFNVSDEINTPEYMDDRGVSFFINITL